MLRSVCGTIAFSFSPCFPSTIPSTIMSMVLGTYFSNSLFRSSCSYDQNLCSYLRYERNTRKESYCIVTALQVHLLLSQACRSPISASRGCSGDFWGPQTPFHSETRWQEKHTADLQPESKHLGEISSRGYSHTLQK